MSHGDAIIRSFVYDNDNKLVRFMVAKAAMEPLAVANRKTTMHPLIVSLWVALSCVFIQVLDFWPDPRYGFLGYLRPLPAFAAFSLPIMFFIDWHQRPQFEKLSTDALKRPDITNIGEYYTRTPSSGLWLYEFGDQFVGLIAVDASMDTLSEDAKARESMTTSTAVIRHFYVAEPYRLANAQDDLIAFATKRVFDSSSNVERIRVSPSPLSDYLGRSLSNAGFEVVERGAKVGILGWTTLTYELTREKWKASQK